MQERMWLLTIEALDELNNPVVLRFASGDYTDPSGNYYDLRLKQPCLYTNSAFFGSVIQTGSQTGYGEAVLVNTDGGLDYLADYAVDGRTMTLSLRVENGSVEFVLSGSVQNLRFEDSTISVQLRDEQALLDNPHPYTTYKGDNLLPMGVEGLASDIRGNPKPIVYGKVRNMEPVLVNTVNRIYQVHDHSKGADVDVIAVYDRGVLLTLHTTEPDISALFSATPPPGFYSKSGGYFRLGVPPNGVLTADVDASATLAGDVVEKLLLEVGCTLTSTSKTLLNNESGNVGFFIKDEKTTSSLLNTVAQGVGAYWYIETNKQVTFGLLTPPNTPQVELFDYQIVSISRSSTGAGSNGLPVHKVKLKADKIELVQTDVAPGADEEVRSRVKNEWRESVYENPSVKERHPLSEEIIVETGLRDFVKADQQAQRIQELLGVRRDTVSVVVRVDEEVLSALAIGNTVRINSYKLGYSAGKNFKILGYTLNAKLSRIELSLFG